MGRPYSGQLDKTQVVFDWSLVIIEPPQWAYLYNIVKTNNHDRWVRTLAKKKWIFPLWSFNIYCPQWMSYLYNLNAAKMIKTRRRTPKAPRPTPISSEPGVVSSAMFETERLHYLVV